MSNDMSSAIIPRSDQLNSDDLIAGPRTIKITKVVIRGGEEQPVSIFYEGDDGKPFKSCKSMNRVLVSAWGPDASKYVGRSLTLYRDPTVKWGGMEVGGIRISHMTDIDGPMVLALTATKGSRKPFTVKPLVTKAAPVDDPGMVAFIVDQLTLTDNLPGEWKRLATEIKALTPSGLATVTAAKDARKAELALTGEVA